MDKRVKNIIWTKEQIIKRIDELAVDINDYYSDKEPPILLGILKGCLVFYGYLSTRLKCEIETEFLKADATMGTTTKEKVDFSYSFLKPLDGKNILIVEDIIDTATTLKTLMNELKDKNVADIKIVALVDKFNNRRIDLDADWVGFKHATNEWIVGWGIDANEELRHLPFIGTLKDKYKG